MLQAHYCDASVHTPVFFASWNVALLWRYCSNYGIDYCYVTPSYQDDGVTALVTAILRARRLQALQSTETPARDCPRKIAIGLPLNFKGGRQGVPWPTCP